MLAAYEVYLREKANLEQNVSGFQMKQIFLDLLLSVSCVSPKHPDKHSWLQRTRDNHLIFLWRPQWASMSHTSTWRELDQDEHGSLWSWGFQFCPLSSRKNLTDIVEKESSDMSSYISPNLRRRPRLFQNLSSESSVLVLALPSDLAVMTLNLDSDIFSNHWKYTEQTVNTK